MAFLTATPPARPPFGPSLRAGGPPLLLRARILPGLPANRIGYGRFTLPQLKVIQEVVTLAVFGAFTALWMRERLHLNHLWAALCLVGAVFFTFRK
ncbi:DMT family protein [Geothrix rubra]|uniref:DMT family protein n=1 Tax=Geothrix rubra TaxID=2927977 RepID=UPI0028693153|nr:DMT family protein [Geothrix rubra]